MVQWDCGAAGSACQKNGQRKSAKKISQEKHRTKGIWSDPAQSSTTPCSWSHSTAGQAQAGKYQNKYLK